MQFPDKDALLRRVKAHRAHWVDSPKPADREPAGEGRESVWDYPRPPAVQDVAPRLCVVFAGETIADTLRGRRIVETAGAPVYYFPPADVRQDALRPTGRMSVCEWKGMAVYYDITVGARRAPAAAFAYPDPFDDLGQGYGRIAGWLGFYAGKMDACYVGDERAAPQPGGVYAGWVTTAIAGPIKGAPGSEGW